MKITKIEKKKRLYLVEIDQKESLYVTEDTVVKYMLTKEKTLSKNQLEDIKNFAQFSHGKNLALYFISFKQRTEKEVRDYLFKHEINPHIIPQIIDKLLESLAQQNLKYGDKGAYALKQKWLQKGCEKQVIDEVLTQFDFSEVAIKVASKLLRKYQGKLPTKSLKDKLTQNLINKGFTFQESKQAIDQLELEADEENEQTLLYKEIEKQYQKFSKKYDGYELKQRLTQSLARKGYDFNAIASALREYF